MYFATIICVYMRVSYRFLVFGFGSGSWASYGSGIEEEGIADDGYGVHPIFVSASALRRDR